MVNSLRFFVRCGSSLRFFVLNSLRFFVLNSLRFFVRCGSRWRAGTQLGLTELRRWTICTMIVPPWNHDLTSQTSFRFQWLHYQSSHILEKARNQNWHLSVIYNDKGYASKALNGLCPTRTDNFCWITSLPILTQGILILFRDQSALLANTGLHRYSVSAVGFRAGQRQQTRSGSMFSYANWIVSQNMT